MKILLRSKVKGQRSKGFPFTFELSALSYMGGFFLFLVSCFLLLSACQFRIPKDPNIMVRPMGAEPSSLNPVTAAIDGVARGVYSGFIYESLIERDSKTLEIVPWLAEKWTVSADHLSYTFYLRKDVKWHDGVPFTADDVVYTFEQIRNPKIFAPELRIYLIDIDRIEKIDDYTVRFIWKKPYFKALEICGGVEPVPKHIFNDGGDFNSHWANRKPIGTGPFKFVEWKTGRKIVLEANENYWKGKPGIDGVLFKTVTDESVTLHELKKGEFDVGSVSQIQWVRQTDTPAIKKGFVKARFFTPNFTWIGWNMRRPYFSDAKVRTALTMLIDIPAIINRLLFGQGRQTTGPFYVDSPAYDRSVNPLPYDPSGAKAILDKAGWIDHDGDGIRDKDGIKFSFTYLVPAGIRFYEQLANIMRENFKNAGINVEVDRLEWASFVNHINTREFDAISLVWGVGIDMDPYQIWHSSQMKDGSNAVGYSNPEVDRLIEKGRVEFDAGKRNEMYKDIHRLIYKDQPYTFLFAGTSLMLRSNRFSNVNDYMMGWDYREWGVKHD